MDKIIIFSLYFIATFIITYLISFFTLVRKSKKKNNNKNKDKIPVEVQYLITKYKINLKDINYRKFINCIALVGSFDMAVAVTIPSGFKNIYIQLIFAFLILMPLILISFGYIGKFYKKKGNDENEHERNRK